MTTCFSCQTELSEQVLYCKNCGTQVRCKNPECRDVLEPHARFCGACGSSTEGSVVAPVVDVNGNSESSHALNTLDFDETTKSRSLHAKLTDRAVESLSSSLGVYVGNHISVISRVRRTPGHPTLITENQQLQLPGYDQEPIDHDGKVIDIEPSASASQPPAAGTERENLRRFFSYDGDRLRLIDSRLKAKSKRDQGQRLAIMFLYAHELEDREKVPRASLNTILDEAKVNDGNIRFWIGKADEFLKDGNKIGLSVPGRERARKILAEALDSTIPDSWSLSSAPRARGGKSGGTADDRKGKKKSAGGKRANASYACPELPTTVVL